MLDHSCIKKVRAGAYDIYYVFVCYMIWYDMMCYDKYDMYDMICTCVYVCPGVHIFPSEHTVRKKTSQLLYDYICGTVNVDGDNVSFIRITNIQHVIESLLHVLHKQKRMLQYGNIPYHHT